MQSMCHPDNLNSVLIIFEEQQMVTGWLFHAQVVSLMFTEFFLSVVI